MTAPAKNQSAPGRNWRWSLVALLFFATTINYLDRIVLAVLIPVIRKDLGFSDREYGLITGAFQIAV
jgi:MFS transporter, ACS family, hexuronate transporter